MPIAQTAEPTPQTPLRLWPGVVAVVLQWLLRFGLKMVVPGFTGFKFGIMGGLLGGLVIVVWWAFFSRAPRSERWGAIVLMIAALFATARLNYESIGPVWVIGCATRVRRLSFVAWAVASRRLSAGLRRAAMVAVILLACGGWTAVRTTGITGDHVMEFAWRWTKTSEVQLLTQAGDQPAALPTAPPAAETAEKPPTAQAGGEPAALPK